jgi:secondary thiamine-phosphate synthase enzyme
VQKFVTASGVVSGVCIVYVPHTTAGLVINEGYDPAVAQDLESALDRLVLPQGAYHHAEGNSDSHIKVALTGTSQIVFVENGKLALGRWQDLFFCEFDGPRHRSVLVKVLRDPL